MTAGHDASDRFEALLRELAKMPALCTALTPQSGDRLAGGRFRLGRVLGEGAMGVVFEAFDNRRGAQVALKTLRSADPTGLFRLKNEFRALADVVHPNLVRLHELFSEGEHWFFTMERIEGEDFARWVRPQARFDEARVRSGLAQLLHGLTAIHGAGKLHGDLKPSNVLVRASGRVQILDFGLAVDFQFGASPGGAVHTGLHGTPAYMAPEQAVGSPREAASDYYALGVMLFQAMTGVLPFTGPAVQMLAEKRGSVAPAPSSLAPGLPADLEQACGQLLARDPAARPDAAQLLSRFGGSGADARFESRGEHGKAHAAALLGRDVELAALHQAYAAACAGTPVVLCVSGESGIGKTMLCETFLSELRAAGRARVLTSRCRERESVPFKAVDPWVDALCSRALPAETAAAWLPADSAALATLFPVLARIPGVAPLPAGRILDPREVRRRGVATFAEWMRRVAREQPLVLYVDDLQWTDRDSVLLLTQWLAERAPAPALLLLSQRSEGTQDGVGPSRGLSRVIAPEHGRQTGLPPRATATALTMDALAAAVLEAAHASPGWQLRTLTLGPLCAQATRELARRSLPRATAAERSRPTGHGNLTETSGMDDRVAASERALTSIVREAAGHPFLAIELAHLLATRKAHAGPVSLAALLQARVSALPERARRLLELVAVAGQPLARQLALDAAGAAHDDLDALLTMRMLRTAVRDTDPPIECYHDKIREGVSAALSLLAARATHARLAEVLRMHDNPIRSCSAAAWKALAIEPVPRSRLGSQRTEQPRRSPSTARPSCTSVRWSSAPRGL